MGIFVALGFTIHKAMLPYSMVKANQIQPLFDRVLVAPELELQSSAGIYVPRDANERSQIMKVVAVGDVQTVAVGDRVVVAKYAGTEVCVGEEKLLIIKECEVLCRFC